MIDSSNQGGRRVLHHRPVLVNLPLVDGDHFDHPNFVRRLSRPIWRSTSCWIIGSSLAASSRTAAFIDLTFVTLTKSLSLERGSFPPTGATSVGSKSPYGLPTP